MALLNIQSVSLVRLISIKVMVIFISTSILLLGCSKKDPQQEPREASAPDSSLTKQSEYTMNLVVSELLKLNDADFDATIAIQDDHEVLMLLGWAMYDQKHYDRAFKIFKKSSELGNQKALFNIGRMYYDGQGTTKNYPKALEIMTYFAEQGDVDAQHNLAHMYWDGYAVPQNYKKAFEIYIKLANQGDADSQNNLGIMYKNGYGVKKDIKLAKEWFGKACNGGNQEACTQI